ncbi:MAG TPA: sensor histidine kinase, partial [Pseudonocardiaceae bacterium]
MRTRLLAVVISLVVLVVIGLGAPLAVTVASTEGQQLFADRLTDTDRFASTAQHPLSSGDFRSLTRALVRYEQVYRIPAAVLDISQRVDAQSLTPINLADPAVENAVRAASAGRSAQSGSTLYPWHTAPLVVAEPVLLDGQLIGVVVTVSATGRVREAILGW